MELSKEKRGHFLYRLFCLKEIFFKICILSQYIVYWIHFQNIHTFTNQKTLLLTLLLLGFKIVKSLQHILKVQLSPTYFPVHQPALQIPCTCSLPTPHIYSTFPIRGTFWIRLNNCSGAFFVEIANVLKVVLVTFLLVCFLIF